MKKVIGIILIIVISLVILTGCTSEARVTDRFELVQRWEGGTYDNLIMYDKETKVQYYVIRNIGITLLVDAEGKPLLYQGE